MLTYFNQSNYDPERPFCPYCQRPMKKELDFIDVDFVDVLALCTACSFKWAKTGSPSIDALFWKQTDKTILYKLSLYVSNLKVDFTNDGNGSTHTDFFIHSDSEEAYNGYELYLSIDEDIEFDGMDKETLIKQISFYITYG